jgi:hypothetical protein
MTMGPDNLGGGPAATQERFAGQHGYRSSRREAGLAAEDPADHGMGPRAFPMPGPPPANGGVPGLEHPDDLDRSPTLTSMDLGGLSEPVFPPPGWTEQPGDSLVDHPLLRGLLMELPPKGAAPSPGWLDRWFEAARSILELLYIDGDLSRSR